MSYAARMRIRALLLLLTAVVATAACTANPPTPAPPPQTTATATATATVTTTAAPVTSTVTAATTAASSTAPDLYAARQETVERLIDGDTLVLVGGVRVRVIGINTPEISSPVECYGPEAVVNAEELLPVGSKVTITPDRSQGLTDRYGRTLAYVQTPEDLDFGYVMLQEGAAREYTYTKSKPYERQERYRLAQTEAKAQKVGLWDVTKCPTP